MVNVPHRVFAIPNNESGIITGSKQYHVYWQDAATELTLILYTLPYLLGEHPSKVESKPPFPACSEVKNFSYLHFSPF